MKIRSYLYLISVLFAGAMVSACKYNTEISNPDDFVKVYMSQATEAPAIRSFVMSDTAGTIIYGASFGGPKTLDKDVNVSFKISPELVSSFNTENGTDYAMLPDGSYQLEESSGIVQKGETSTAPLKLRIKTKGFLEPFKQYLLPVSIAAASSNMPVNESLKTTFFRIDAQREGMTFKVFSYGKGGGYNDLNVVADLINAQNADIVLVREMDLNTTRSNKTDQPAVLAGLIGMPNYVFAPSIVSYQGGQYGATVYSRFPINKSETFLLPTGDTNTEKGPLAILELQMNANQKIIFAGTHLNANAARRTAELTELLKITGNYAGQPMVMAGNFNDRPPAGPVYVTLAGAQWEYPCTTCPANSPVVNPVNYSDFIMYRSSQEFRVLSHTVGTTSTSAHLPVITAFTLYKD